jgi:hypothetical protein
LLHLAAAHALGSLASLPLITLHVLLLLLLFWLQVVLADGDLNSEQLGLSAATTQQLLEQVDIVIHSAASIGRYTQKVDILMVCLQHSDNNNSACAAGTVSSTSCSRDYVAAGSSGGGSAAAAT